MKCSIEEVPVLAGEEKLQLQLMFTSLPFILVQLTKYKSGQYLMAVLVHSAVQHLVQPIEFLQKLLH
jgi:heme/copper-type cytochrome/quinol oxidase subunit 4